MLNAVKDFLHRLGDGRALKLADRAEANARQYSRRHGYALFTSGRWHLTTAGREFLYGAPPP